MGRSSSPSSLSLSLASAAAPADERTRSSLACAAVALLGVAAAALYLGAVDAGLTPRKHAAAYFCRNRQQAFRKALAPDQLVWMRLYVFYAYRWSEFA